ncbi:ATP-binding protein [Sphingomonas sp. ID0503]|uniref:ATP-binding protein n=1 Tax=Sphingomonas sp. ID0503 TaxID=3399691 RepID=UPI003AFB5D5C
MNEARRWSVGLLGRVLAVLLLTVVVEFGVSTLLYERASRLSVHEDEAARLAEAIAPAVRLLNATPQAQRPTVADHLSTERYIFTWRPVTAKPPLTAPALPAMRLQVTAWEPMLANTGLRLYLRSPGRGNVVVGDLLLADGSALEVLAPGLVQESTLASNRIALALAPALALVVIGGLLLRVMVQPVRQLARAADLVGEGQVIELAESGPTEIRRLIRAFNGMQHRIAGLIEGRTRALAAVGHDLRTPISRLRLRTESIDNRQLRETFDADLAEIEQMLASLFAFYGRETETERQIRLDVAVMVASLVDEFADHGDDVTYHGPDHCELMVYRTDLRRAVTNLINNACHYGERVAVSLGDRPEEVVIAVEDDGPGIPEAQLKTVLEPFVRLDEARSRNTAGLGLGLSIVDSAARKMGGEFTLENRAGGGLRATIRLPKTATAT